MTPRSRLEIYLFGSFEVKRAGVALPAATWKNEKTKALLKILTSQRGRLFTHDQLIEHLWPEAHPRSAASNLRGRIAELRRLLQPEPVEGKASLCICTRAHGYVFEAQADCWIDIEEFARLEREGRRCAGEGRWAEAANAYEDACQLYRGEYLAEDPYEEWALENRAHWRERYLDLLRALSDCRARLGQYSAAMGWVRRALTQAPTDENLYCQWMLYAQLAGNKGEAERAFQRCREVLETTMGEQPSSSTLERYDRVRTGKLVEKAGDYPAVTTTLDASVVRALNLRHPPLIGRDAEFAQLVRMISRAQQGEGGLVLIRGAAGMGKTRLAEEAIRWAQERLGAAHITAPCYPSQQPLAYRPLFDGLRACLSSMPVDVSAALDPLWRAELAQVLPELAASESVANGGAPLPREYRRYRMSEALKQILLAWAIRSPPLVLFLDDLQWADAATIDLLASWGQQLQTQPVLILGACRPEEFARADVLDALLPRLASELSLTPLSSSSVQQLCDELASDFPRLRGLEGVLYRQSGGNPLLLLTLIQELYDRGELTGLDSVRQSRDEKEPIPLPLCLQSAWKRTFARLPDPQQRLAQILAVAGPRVELGALERVWGSGTDEHQLWLAVCELMRKGLLIERGDRFEFSHEQLREAVYDSTPTTLRRQLHRRVAEVLDRHSSPDHDLVVHHLAKAGEVRRALARAAQAVQRLLDAHENEAALTMTEFALQLVEALDGRRDVDHEVHWALRCARVELQLRLEQRDAAGRELERLFALTDSVDEMSRAQAHRLRAYWHERCGRYADALREASEALECYERLHVAEGIAQSAYEMGLASFYLGDYRAATQSLGRALDEFRALANVRGQFEAWDALGHAQLHLEEPAKALACHQQALGLARKLKDRRCEGDALNSLGQVQLHLGKPEEARASFERALSLDRVIGNRLGEAISLFHLGRTHSEMGLYAQALDLFDHAQAIVSKVGHEGVRGAIERAKGRALLGLGEGGAAVDCLQRALDDARALGDRLAECESLLALGEALDTLKQHDCSAETLQCALALSEASGWATLSARIERALHATRLGLARVDQ